MCSMPIISRMAVALMCGLLLVPASPAQAAEKLRVVTSMSTLGSLIASVGGDRVEVTSLVPIGASPEDYAPTPRDIIGLRSAQVLVQNGAGLEGWLKHTLESARNPNVRIVTMTDGLPVQTGNPHLWMDPEFARVYVRKIRDALAASDPAGKPEYDRNAKNFDAQLVALARWIRTQIASLPPDHRNMIVFHNAWQYYNDRFGIATVGVIERSPGQEPSPRYIGDLAALAKKNHVRAIFAEPEYSPKLVRALADTAHVKTVTNLYDDSLSIDGSIHDYISMLRYDTTTIVAALR